MSLFDECVKTIFYNNVDYEGKIGCELKERLDKLKIYNVCGNIVTTRIKIEENRKPDPYMGYLEGIMSANQCKNYVYSNSKLAERSLKQGEYHGHFGSTYMLYYLKQEDGFYDWYKFKDREYINYDKSGNEGERIVVYEMQILENVAGKVTMIAAR